MPTATRCVAADSFVAAAYADMLTVRAATAPSAATRRSCSQCPPGLDDSNRYYDDTPPSDAVILGRAAVGPRGTIRRSMAASTATVARRLPRGWAHLALQFAFWIGFYFAYQLARGVADRGGVAAAFAERRVDHRLPAQPRLDGRADAAAGGRELRLPDPGDVVHLLALAVRRRRDRPDVGLLQGARAVLRLSEHVDRRQSDRPRRLRAAADGAAADVPRGGFTDTLAAHSTVNHLHVRCLRRTHTPRCRACTPSTRSSSAS